MSNRSGFRMIHLRDPIEMSPVRSVLQDLLPVVYEVNAVRVTACGDVLAVASMCPWDEPVRDRDLLRRLGREALRILGVRRAA